jgi:hypothetical protein
VRRPAAHRERQPYCRGVHYELPYSIRQALVALAILGAGRATCGRDGLNCRPPRTSTRSASRAGGAPAWPFGGRSVGGGSGR